MRSIVSKSLSNVALCQLIRVPRYLLFKMLAVIDGVARSPWEAVEPKA